MAWMVVTGQYDDYRVQHVFEDRYGEHGAERWAEQFNTQLPPRIASDLATVEEIGLTLAGQAPPPVVPVVIDGQAVDSDDMTADHRLLG